MNEASDPGDMFTLSGDRQTVRFETNLAVPGPMPGEEQLFSLQIDFDGESIEDLILHLMRLRATMLGAGDMTH